MFRVGTWRVLGYVGWFQLWDTSLLGALFLSTKVALVAKGRVVFFNRMVSLAIKMKNLAVVVTHRNFQHHIIKHKATATAHRDIRNLSIYIYIYILYRLTSSVLVCPPHPTPQQILEFFSEKSPTWMVSVMVSAMVHPHRPIRLCCLCRSWTMLSVLAALLRQLLERRLDERRGLGRKSQRKFRVTFRQSKNLVFVFLDVRQQN